ncbi:MAG TPA: hypothetical protein VF200_11990 [Woeseiaceae bacterium]
MIVITCALVGAALGMGSGVLVGLCAGAAIGYLLSRLSQVQRALDRVQATLEVQRRQSPVPQTAPVEPAAALLPPASSAAAPREPRPSPAGPPPHTQPAPPLRPTAPAMQLSERAMRPAARVAAPPPDAFDRAFAAGRRWLTTGNVPVKVGVIISFFGVAFLLKYAVDRNLLVLPWSCGCSGSRQAVSCCWPSAGACAVATPFMR